MAISSGLYFLKLPAGKRILVNLDLAHIPAVHSHACMHTVTPK